MHVPQPARRPQRCKRGRKTERGSWNSYRRRSGRGELAEEATWQAVVLIPKGEKDYWGIGLVELMWKVVAEILNHRFAASITYHDFLYGFRAGRGTGTATLR